MRPGSREAPVGGLRPSRSPTGWFDPRATSAGPPGRASLRDLEGLVRDRRPRPHEVFVDHRMVSRGQSTRELVGFEGCSVARKPGRLLVGRAAAHEDAPLREKPGRPPWWSEPPRSKSTPVAAVGGHDGGEGMWSPLRRPGEREAVEANSWRGSPLRRLRGVGSALPCVTDQLRGSVHSSTLPNLNRNPLPPRVVPSGHRRRDAREGMKSVAPPQIAERATDRPCQLQPIELPQFRHL